MALYGPFPAGSVSDLGDNGAPWTNPNFAIVTSATNFASCPVNSQTTNTLEFKSFGPFPGVVPLDKISRIGVSFNRKADNTDALVAISLQLICNGRVAGTITEIDQGFFTFPLVFTSPNGGFTCTDDDFPKWDTNVFGANLDANFGIRMNFLDVFTPINTLYINQMSLVMDVLHIDRVPPFRLTSMSQPIIPSYDPVASG